MKNPWVISFPWRVSNGWLDLSSFRVVIGLGPVALAKGFGEATELLTCAQKRKHKTSYAQAKRSLTANQRSDNSSGTTGRVTRFNFCVNCLWSFLALLIKQIIKLCCFGSLRILFFRILLTYHNPWCFWSCLKGFFWTKNSRLLLASEVKIVAPSFANGRLVGRRNKGEEEVDARGTHFTMKNLVFSIPKTMKNQGFPPKTWFLGTQTTRVLMVNRVP